jgi:hypothetical protein
MCLAAGQKKENQTYHLGGSPNAASGDSFAIQYFINKQLISLVSSAL